MTLMKHRYIESVSMDLAKMSLNCIGLENMFNFIKNTREVFIFLLSISAIFLQY